jgi:RNA polymerase sigma-70 factor (ECF subfamily)
LPTVASDALALTPFDLGDTATRPDRKTAELVRRAREGDHDAFAVLVEQHERMVLRTAVRLLGRLDRAQDASQETFLRLFRYLGRFDETREMGPWLYRVVVNVCRDLGRRAGAGRLVALDDARETLRAAGPGERDGAFEAVARDERQRLVQAAVMTLPERERAAVVLRDLEGRPSPEVARILGSSEGTVRSQVASARLKIKRFIESRSRARGRGDDDRGDDR